MGVLAVCGVMWVGALAVYVVPVCGEFVKVNLLCIQQWY